MLTNYRQQLPSPLCLRLQRWAILTVVQTAIFLTDPPHSLMSWLTEALPEHQRTRRRTPTWRVGSHLRPADSEGSPSVPRPAGKHKHTPTLHCCFASVIVVSRSKTQSKTTQSSCCILYPCQRTISHLCLISNFFFLINLDSMCCTE